MERSDSRLLPVAALNERRRRAVILRLNGMTLDEVCALSKLSRNTVIAALKAYRAGGWEAVAVQAHRGPGKGAGCLLDAEPQQAIQAIQALIHAHTPDELGLPFALGLHAAKAAQQDVRAEPAAVRAWLNDEYLTLARRAKAEDGEIYWGDETGLRSDDVHGPVMRRRAERQWCALVIGARTSA